MDLRNAIFTEEVVNVQQAFSAKWREIDGMIAELTNALDYKGVKKAGSYEYSVKVHSTDDKTGKPVVEYDDRLRTIKLFKVTHNLKSWKIICDHLRVYKLKIRDIRDTNESSSVKLAKIDELYREMIETIPTKLVYETVEVGQDALKDITSSIKELRDGPPRSTVSHELGSQMDSLSHKIMGLMDFNLLEEKVKTVIGMKK